MLFSNPAYLPFLALAAVVFYLLPSMRQRLAWLGLTSYVFYGLFEPAYILLLTAVTLISYFGAILIDRFQGRMREVALLLAVASTFGLLIFFKYFNFLSETLTALLSIASGAKDPFLISVILPVGISFYTFHAVAYVADVYVGKIAAEQRMLNYVAFISFFPQLNAGPIERGNNILPQLDRLATFDPRLAASGLRLILLGLFLKVLCADTLSYVVDPVYNRASLYSAKDHVLAAVYFSFQVYADFAGYSLIALGSGRILGIELMRNFRQPFLADSIPEFWRTWHISLSTWLQDYLFTPLRLKWRQLGMTGLYLSIGVTFLVAGIWHGAGWKYVLFGLLHSAYMIASIATLKARNEFYERIGLRSTVLRCWRTLVTFTLVVGSFILFRANSVSDAVSIYRQIADVSSWAAPTTILQLKYVVLIGVILAIDLFARSGFDFMKLPVALRWSIYYACVAPIGYAMIMRYGSEPPFIYFQF